MLPDFLMNLCKCQAWWFMSASHLILVLSEIRLSSCGFVKSLGMNIRILYTVLRSVHCVSVVTSNYCMHYSSEVSRDRKVEYCGPWVYKVYKVNILRLCPTCLDWNPWISKVWFLTYLITKVIEKNFSFQISYD